jgi:methylenetetrahydrofolate dehydrogenase (NADP+)/methenyltetrahydrofolate cyclohydrolase
MDGAALAQEVLARTAERASRFARETGTRPCLATVLVGDDPTAAMQVRLKHTRCAAAGIEARHVALPATVTTSEIVGAIAALSRDPGVHGVFLQHPVPPHLDERAAFEAIALAKDVDAVTMRSFAAMALGRPGFVACTPGGMLRLLDAYGVDPAGKHAVIVGCGDILGKPAGLLLLRRDATVTYCHARTVDLPSVIRTGDIVVAAVGQPAFVRGAWLKPGAVVLDAGYNPGNAGDVAFDEAVQRASLISPVPGGLGPLTIAVLLEQTVEAAIRQRGPAPGGQ